MKYAFEFSYSSNVRTEQQQAAVVLWSYMNLESFARHIRDACIDAALQAYEDAGVQGLCALKAVGKQP